MCIYIYAFVLVHRCIFVQKIFDLLVCVSMCAVRTCLCIWFLINTHVYFAVAFVFLFKHFQYHYYFIQQCCSSKQTNKQQQEGKNRCICWWLSRHVFILSQRFVLAAMAAEWQRRPIKCALHCLWCLWRCHLKWMPHPVCWFGTAAIPPNMSPLLSATARQKRDKMTKIYCCSIKLRVQFSLFSWNAICEKANDILHVPIWIDSD